jgi:hypothetical protein
MNYLEKFHSNKIHLTFVWRIIMDNNIGKCDKVFAWYDWHRNLELTPAFQSMNFARIYIALTCIINDNEVSSSCSQYYRNLIYRRRKKNAKEAKFILVVFCKSMHGKVLDFFSKSTDSQRSIEIWFTLVILAFFSKYRLSIKKIRYSFSWFFFQGRHFNILLSLFFLLSNKKKQKKKRNVSKGLWIL